MKKIISYNKRTAFVAIVMSLLLSFGCNRKVDKQNTSNDYYPSGEVKSKVYTNREGVLVDTAYYYYKNGEDSLIEVRNDSGILSGDYVFYYDNGDVFEQGTNSSGEKEGISTRYYKGGGIKSINFYMNDKVIGDVFAMYSTGRIEYYAFYDFQERARTYISWDSVGNVKTSIGRIVYVDSVKVDTAESIYKIALLISNPPSTRTEVIIGYLGKNNDVLKADTLIDERFFSTSGKLDGKINIIRFYGVQYDSLGNALYKDSSYKILDR